MKYWGIIANNLSKAGWNVIGFLDMVGRVEITELLFDQPKWVALWPNKPQRTFGFASKDRDSFVRGVDSAASTLPAILSS